MKGLIVNMMAKKSEVGKKQEAIALCKKGVMFHLKSSTAWHIFGLLYRAERMYPDAIKCYANALKYDSENQNILKDLAALQIQTRAIEGYTETRRKILTSKSNHRGNWMGYVWLDWGRLFGYGFLLSYGFRLIGCCCCGCGLPSAFLGVLRCRYAIGAHLSGNYKLAVHVLDSFRKTVDDPTKAAAAAASSSSSSSSSAKKKLSFEDSELLVYRNQVILESGELEEALTDLNNIERDGVSDSLALRTRRAAILLKLGRRYDAETDLRFLLDVNPENLNYHMALRYALGLEQSPAAEAADGEEKKGASSASASAASPAQQPFFTQPQPASSSSTSASSVSASSASAGVTFVRKVNREQGFLPSSSNGHYTSEQVKKLSKLYFDDLQVAFPKSDLCQRLPLDFLPGNSDEFAKALKAYIVPRLRDGIPNLFRDLRSLYACIDKVWGLLGMGPEEEGQG